MNILAILVAAFVAFVIGFLWHGPLFGKIWMRLENITPTGNEKFSDMWKQMVYNYIANIVMAFVISGTLMFAFSSPFMGELTWYRGAICGAWLWLGFVVTTSSMDVIWMKRSVKLWLFELSWWLVAMMAMGAILAVWQ
jgi:hypothetical protein